MPENDDNEQTWGDAYAEHMARQFDGYPFRDVLKRDKYEPPQFFNYVPPQAQAAFDSAQLDRIEQKLDRLLSILDDTNGLWLAPAPDKMPTRTRDES